MNNNNTCGECRYHKNNRCMLPCHTINHPAENSACHRFEVKTPLTNGDVIRQMSNEELAAIFLNKGKFPPICDDVPKTQCISCRKCWIAWLNAPAESEGEDE